MKAHRQDELQRNEYSDPISIQAEIRQYSGFESQEYCDVFKADMIGKEKLFSIR